MGIDELHENLIEDHGPNPESRHADTCAESLPIGEMQVGILDGSQIAQSNRQPIQHPIEGSEPWQTVHERADEDRAGNHSYRQRTEPSVANVLIEEDSGNLADIDHDDGDGEEDGEGDEGCVVLLVVEVGVDVGGDGSEGVEGAQDDFDEGAGCQSDDLILLESH